MKKLFLAIVAISVLAAPLSAQQGPPRAAGAPPAGPGEIMGTLVDAETGTPIASASVSVRNSESVLVAGAIANPDGSFRVVGLMPGTYTLRYTMIGYAVENSQPITITAASPRAMLGQIKLTRQAVEISAVEVNAERSVVIAPDRTAYQVKDVAPAATNASDVLDNVPAVQVDADGKVSLRGNENVVVQINGRPTPITGAQLGAYLKGLPANTIERVEVIPNPSAKQDPEGMAGIINIVMKQGVDLGTSGGITLAASTENRYNVSGNIGHQRGKIAFFGTYSFISDERFEVGVNDRTRFDPSRLPLSFTNQDVDNENDMMAHNVTLNLDYNINKRDALLSTFTFNRRGSDAGSFMAYDELDGDGNLLDQYLRRRGGDNTATMMDGSLSFKRTIAPQRHEFTAEVRGHRMTEDDATRMWRQALTGEMSEIETNDTDATTNQYTLQLDYTRPLGEKLKLETGYKGNLRKLDRDFLVMKDELGNGNFVRSDLSNALEFDETVNAVYAVLSGTTEKFDWQAGLRGEYASRNFSLANEDGDYPYDYTSLFPSALINFKLNDKTQTKLSYSRRIRRPNQFELNPFPQFFDINNVFMGNPNLNPEYTDAIELSFQRSGSLGSFQISPFYRRTNDIIRVDINTADTVGGREVTTINFKNLDHSDSWGADVNGQFRLSKALSGFAGFNIFKMVTDGGSQSALSSNAVSWMARLNASYNVTDATTLQAAYFYRAPMKIERGEFAAASILNVTVRQKLSRSSSLTLRVQDPFETMKFRVNVGDDNIHQLTTREFNTRALFLTYQWNFGQAPKLKQRRQEEPQQAPQTPPFGN